MEEALAILGRVLRADQALRTEFLRWAEEAYCARWTPPRPTSREEAVAFAALDEAIRRLSEQRGWRRERKAEPQVLGLEEAKAQEILGRIKTGRPPQGAFYLRGNPSPKALKAAAKRLISGGEIYVPRLTPEMRKLILSVVAEELASRRSGPKVKTPWGEELPLLPGDRWEDPEAVESRIQRAHEVLRELVIEAEAEAFAEAEVEDTTGWQHEVRLNARWFAQAYRRATGEEVSDLFTLWALLEDPEAMRIASEAGAEYGSVRVRKTYPEWYPKARELLRRNVPTYEQIRGALPERLLYWSEPLALALALQANLRDPLSGAQEVLWLWARRLSSSRYDINPLIFLEAEGRKLLMELRLKEKGRLTDREVRTVRRALALAYEGKEEEVRSLLEEEELEWVLQGEASLEEAGEGVATEIDYDTLVLRRKIKELRQEVKLLYGEEGLLVMEALIEGVTMDPGHPVVQYLREELSGWVEEG